MARDMEELCLYQRPRLCGCVHPTTSAELKLCLENRSVDIVEWRLDMTLRHVSKSSVERMLRGLPGRSKSRIIFTCRPEREGGFWKGDEASRMDFLRSLVGEGAGWVDLEWDTPFETVDSFRSLDCRILVSRHHFEGLPDRETLRAELREMRRLDPDALKLVATAHSTRDNLRILELVSSSSDEIPVIAFGMGPKGRWSRVVSLLLGSPWAYVSMPGFSATAPGQWESEEFLEAFRLLAGPSRSTQRR